jgi:hypothetical protein
MAFVACSLEKAPSYGLRGIPRIEDLDSKANEILHIPGDKREVVMKGCRRNHAVHDGQRQYQANPATRCASDRLEAPRCPCRFHQSS